MNAVKYICGVLFLLACLVLTGAIVWYCMFDLPGQTPEQGTLVFHSMAGGIHV